jgi:hypothetical protein
MWRQTLILAVYVLLYLRGTVEMNIQFSGSEFDMHVLKWYQLE